MTEKIHRAAYRLPDARFIAGSLVATLAVFLGLYGLFLNETVLNIVARKDMEQKLVEIDSRVSQYEFTYINKNSDVTLDMALALGYEEEVDPIYVSVDNPRRFTLND